jgi:hypothetical protein
MWLPMPPALIEFSGESWLLTFIGSPVGCQFLLRALTRRNFRRSGSGRGGTQRKIRTRVPQRGRPIAQAATVLFLEPQISGSCGRNGSAFLRVVDLLSEKSFADVANQQKILRKYSENMWSLGASAQVNPWMPGREPQYFRIFTILPHRAPLDDTGFLFKYDLVFPIFNSGQQRCQD